MNRNEILENALTLRVDAVGRALTMAIRAAAPGQEEVCVQDLYSVIVRFVKKGHAQMNSMPGFDNDFRTQVYQQEVSASPEAGWFQIGWQGHSLEFVEIHITKGYHPSSFALLVGPSKEVVRGFMLALDTFSQEIDGAVLVFQDGCWSFDEELYRDIQSSTFDNLVLPTGQSETIRQDVRQWLESRELYESHGIPWKRGIILIGPPGNGKTHLIKALINEFPLNALYVRGLTSEYQTDAENISSVFSRARACPPAMLIFEDLDTLVNPENRSHFLNELDGFARNTGILAVASANDPEKLDPALVNRPSRFDRRYVFGLPEASERARYLQFFTETLNPELQIGAERASALADATDGFSYAYLKELVLSSMMSWISGGKVTVFTEMVQTNINALREQMTLDVEPTPSNRGDEKSPSARARAMRARGMRRR